MTQRKLMLPAFHGERMEALRGVVTEVAEAEVESWPTGSTGPAPPLHAGADAGGDPARRLRPRAGRAPRAAPRACSTDMLEFAMSPVSLIPPVQRLGRLHPDASAASSTSARRPTPRSRR